MPNIVDFAQIDEEDFPLVGSAGIKLGKISKLGFLTPAGFVISTSFFDKFLKLSNLYLKIEKILKGANLADPFDIFLLAKKIEKEFDNVQIPTLLQQEIDQAWRKYLKRAKPPYIVYPSLTAKGDEGNRAFSNRSYLVFSKEEFLLALKKCWLVQFQPSKLSKYTEEKDFLSPTTAVIVQQKIFGETSGVINTLNPGLKNTCLIYAVWGAFEEHYQEENAYFDIYTVDFKNNKIIEKKIARQERQLVLVGNGMKSLPISAAAKSMQKISDEQIKYLAGLAAEVLKHYYFPQRIQWTIRRNDVFVLDLGTQPFDMERKINISPYSPEDVIKKNDNYSHKIEGRTATKILFKLKSSDDLKTPLRYDGDGFVLTIKLPADKNFAANDTHEFLKLFSRMIDSRPCFIKISNPFFNLSEMKSIQNVLENQSGNFNFVLPVPLWSEKIKKLARLSNIPIWVSCQNYLDLQFIEQYILWGCYGILFILKNNGVSEDLKLNRGDNFHQSLELLTKAAVQYQIGIGLEMEREFMSLDYLREAVFAGFPLVIIPKDAYPWIREEIKLAEQELVKAKHG